MRFSLTTFVLLLTLIATAVPAAAQDTATSAEETAAQSLRSDPVYNDPDAEAALSNNELEHLRSRIRSGKSGPVYVAILPGSVLDSAGGAPDQIVVDLHNTLGRTGTYVVVAGGQIAAGSDLLHAGPIMSQARTDRN